MARCPATVTTAPAPMILAPPFGDASGESYAGTSQGGMANPRNVLIPEH